MHTGVCAHVCPHAYMCEDVCSCVGKQGADGCWGRECCNHDQMDSVFREASTVLSTRRFPALKTNLFKKCTYLLTWSKGNIQANRGFPFLEDWTCSPWASRVKVYLGRVRTLQAQLPGPHGALGPCSLSTSGRGSPYLRVDSFPWHWLCFGSLRRSSHREQRPLPSTPGLGSAENT